MKRIRTAIQLRRIEYYCYLRWCRAQTDVAQLFWINKHTLVGDMIVEQVKQGRED